jgi:hypothetical protein
MPLLAEDIDDIGKIRLGRLRHHIGRGRAVLAHAHVERTVETEREAAFGLIELHRRDADIHHDAIDERLALRGTHIGEIGEAILDQRETTVRCVDQIETTGDGGPVAIDGDDAGSLGRENGAGIAACAECGIDINTTGARAQHVDGFNAENGDMSCIGRAHARAGRRRADSAFRSFASRRKIKLDTNRPMSPQLSARRLAFPPEKPGRRAIAGSIRRTTRVWRGKGRTSAWICRDCHGI